MYCVTQNQINDYWRNYNKKLDITKVREKNYCSKCNEQGYRIKLDKLGNRHERHQYTMYDVVDYVCPRCNDKTSTKMRIDGAGHTGVNSGRMLGGL